MIKRTLEAVALLCALAVALAGSARAQNASTFGNIVAMGVPCGAANCVYYQLPPATPWVNITLSGTWAGSVEVASTTAANATYSNLDTLAWTVLATQSANGTWSAATSGATYVRVRATTWSSGSARVDMASSQVGSPEYGPLFPGVVSYPALSVTNMNADTVTATTVNGTNVNATAVTATNVSGTNGAWGTTLPAGTPAGMIAVGSDSAFRNAICYGDSLCNGNQDGSGVTLCTALVSFMGAGSSCSNQGVSRQTSAQICARQGGCATTVTVVGGSIPASGPVPVTYTSGYEPPYNVTTGYGHVLGDGSCAIGFGLSGIIDGIAGCVKDNGSHVYTFTRLTPGSVTAYTSGPWVPVNPVLPTGSMYLFEACRNNFAAPTTCLADYASMVATVPAGSAYLAFTVLTGTNDGMYELPGNYSQIQSLNKSIMDNNPGSSFDWERLLVSKYNASSLNPFAAADTYAHLDDKVPGSLRAVLSSGTLQAAITDLTSCPSLSTTPTVGSVTSVDTEKIYAISTSGNNVLTCTRGWDQTTPATHLIGAAYNQRDPIHPSGAPAYGQAGGYTLAAQGLYAQMQQMALSDFAATTTNVNAAAQSFGAPSAATSVGDANMKWGKIGGAAVDVIATSAVGSQWNLTPDSGFKLFNPSVWTFAPTTAGWVVTNASNLTYPTASFGNAIVYTGTGGASGSTTAKSKTISVVGGQYYTLSFGANSTAVVSGNPQVSVRSTALTTTYGAVSLWPANANVSPCPFFSGRMCTTFYVPLGVTQVVELVSTGNATVTNGAQLTVGDIQLEPGQRASSYKVNLLDDLSGGFPSPTFPTGTTFGATTSTGPITNKWIAGSSNATMSNCYFANDGTTAILCSAVGPNYWKVTDSTVGGIDRIIVTTGAGATEINSGTGTTYVEIGHGTNAGTGGVRGWNAAAVSWMLKGNGDGRFSFNSTMTACASSASPALCAASQAGFFVVAAAATTVTVNTSAVNAASQIFIQEDSSLGTALSVTCNTTPATSSTVTGRVASTSFTVTTTSPTTNPRCFSYHIIN